MWSIPADFLLLRYPGLVTLLMEGSLNGSGASDGRGLAAGELFARSGMVAEPGEPRKASDQAAMVGPCVISFSTAFVLPKSKGNHGELEDDERPSTSPPCVYLFPILLPITSTLVVNSPRAPIYRYRLLGQSLLRIRLDPAPALIGRCRHSGPDVCSKQESNEQPTVKPAAADFLHFGGILD